MRNPLILLALVGLPALVAPTVRAQPAATGWTFEPASLGANDAGRTHFDYELSPGQAIEDYVRVSNASDQPLTLAFYGADAYTTPQGAFAVETRDKPRRGVGAWVSVPFSTTVVDPHTSVTFPFQLGVPSDAAPGDAAGAVVAVDVSGSSDLASPNVRVEQAIGTRIYVRVKGALRPSLTLTSITTDIRDGGWEPFRDADVTVSYEVTNTGNVRVRATAYADLVDTFGRVVKSLAPRELPELLPRDVTSVTETWSGAPLTGVQIHPRIRLESGDATTTREGASVWHLPLASIVACATLAFASLLFVRLRGRRVGARTQARGIAVISS